MTAPRNVTGNVSSLTGEARAGVRVTFRRTDVGGVFEQDGDIVINEPVSTVSGAGGAIAVTLLPGDYRIEARGNDGTKRTTYTLREDGSTDDLADGIPAASGPITNTILVETQAARDAAIAAVAAVPLTRDAYSTEQDLFDDTVLTYENTVLDQIVPAGNSRYQRLAADDTTTPGQIATAGGVRFKVLPASDGAYHTRAWGNPSGTNDTTNLRAALAAAENGTLVIDYHVAGYDTAVLVPADNTTIVIDPGTVIRAISGGTRVLQIQRENVTVWGYGARLEMDGTQNSHTLYILYPAQNVSVYGLYCYGSGNTGDDVIYVGGTPALDQVAKNIRLYDVQAMGNAVTRNGLSLVAVDGFYAENCKFSNGMGTATPDSAVDIEANAWMSDGSSAVKNWHFKNCDFHDSGNFGFVCIFGSDGTCEDCNSYGNGNSGFAANAGGTQYDDAIYRLGDRLAVSAVSTGDGWLTVSTGTPGVDLLTTDLGIVPGMPVNRQQASGKTWPTEIAAATRWVIAEIDATQTQIRLASNFINGTLVSLSGGSYSGLTTDPTTSALGLLVYGREGNLTGIHFKNCKSYDNIQGGVAKAEVDIGLCGGAILEDFWVRSTNLLNASAVAISFTHRTKIIRGDFRPRVFGTSARGISGATMGQPEIIGAHIEGYGNDGLALSGLTGSVVRDVTVINCGITTAGANAVDIDLGSGGVIDNLNVFNGDAHRVTSGVSVDIANTVTGLSLSNVDARCHPSDTGVSDAGRGTRRRNVLSKGVPLSEVTTSTTAVLGDATNAINTAGKFEGRLVRDTTPTPDRVFMATGSLATSIWLALDGTASITPV